MALTTAQKLVIKADIANNSDMNSLPNNDDGFLAIANLYNAPASPTFWVWKTNCAKKDIYGALSDLTPTPTVWDWTAFKSQTNPEIGVWAEMFTNGTADFSKQNIRDGVASIHGASSNNTKHAIAIGRRPASRLEKLLATGTGSAASPATMNTEGSITVVQVGECKNS